MRRRVSLLLVTGALAACPASHRSGASVDARAVCGAAVRDAGCSDAGAGPLHCFEAEDASLDAARTTDADLDPDCVGPHGEQLCPDDLGAATPIPEVIVPDEPITLDAAMALLVTVDGMLLRIDVDTAGVATPTPLSSMDHDVSFVHEGLLHATEVLYRTEGPQAGVYASSVRGGSTPRAVIDPAALGGLTYVPRSELLSADGEWLAFRAESAAGVQHLMAVATAPDSDPPRDALLEGELPQHPLGFSYTWAPDAHWLSVRGARFVDPDASVDVAQLWRVEPQGDLQPFFEAELGYVQPMAEGGVFGFVRSGAQQPYRTQIRHARFDAEGVTSHVLDGLLGGHVPWGVGYVPGLARGVVIEGVDAEGTSSLYWLDGAHLDAPQVVPLTDATTGPYMPGIYVPPLPGGHAYLFHAGGSLWSVDLRDGEGFARQRLSGELGSLQDVRVAEDQRAVIATDREYIDDTARGYAARLWYTALDDGIPAAPRLAFRSPLARTLRAELLPREGGMLVCAEVQGVARLFHVAENAEASPGRAILDHCGARHWFTAVTGDGQALYVSMPDPDLGGHRLYWVDLREGADSRAVDVGPAPERELDRIQPFAHAGSAWVWTLDDRWNPYSLTNSDVLSALRVKDGEVQDAVALGEPGASVLSRHPAEAALAYANLVDGDVRLAVIADDQPRSLRVATFRDRVLQLRWLRPSTR